MLVQKKAHVEESWTYIFHFSSSQNGAKGLSLYLIDRSRQIVLLRDDNNGTNTKMTHGINYSDNKRHYIVVVSTGINCIKRCRKDK